MRPLKSANHGFFDYVLVAAFGLVPPLMGYPHEAITAFYVLMVVHLAICLATDYPISLFALIPFKLHGILEIVMPFVLLLLPTIAGFSHDTAARNFSYGAAAVLFLAWLVSDYFVERRMSQLPIYNDRRRLNFNYVR